MNHQTGLTDKDAEKPQMHLPHTQARTHKSPGKMFHRAAVNLQTALKAKPSHFSRVRAVPAPASKGHALTNFKAAVASADKQGVGLTLWTKKTCLAKVLKFTKTQASAKKHQQTDASVFTNAKHTSNKKTCLKNAKRKTSSQVQNTIFKHKKVKCKHFLTSTKYCFVPLFLYLYEPEYFQLFSLLNRRWPSSVYLPSCYRLNNTSSASCNNYYYLILYI